MNLFLAVALAVTPITTMGPVDGESRFALVGDRILIQRDHDATTTITSAPLDGTSRPKRLASFTAPRRELAHAQLSASADRAAVAVVTENDVSYAASDALFDGPPFGPLAPLRPFRKVPARGVVWYRPRIQVDGPRLIAWHLRSDARKARYLIFETGSEPVWAKVPARRTVVEDFAGDHVAYVQGSNKHPSLVVANWRTGAVERRLAYTWGDDPVDLRADGALLLNVSGDLLVERPGERFTRIAKRASEAAWAGDRVVMIPGDLRGVIVIEPDGRRRPLGPRTTVATGLIASDTHVAWSANHCLLVAPITGEPVQAPGPGPCARTEVRILADGGIVHHGRTFVGVRCVAGPSGICRGTVRVRGHQRSFRLRASQKRSLRFSVTANSGRLTTIDPGGLQHRQRFPIFRRSRSAPRT
jgi:hypothetical protein